MKLPARGDFCTPGHGQRLDGSANRTDRPFLSTKPSWIGVTEVMFAPMSITRAAGFPEANL